MEWLASNESSLSAKPSVPVLPLNYISHDQSQAYLAWLLTTNSTHM